MKINIRKKKKRGFYKTFEKIFLEFFFKKNSDFMYFHQNYIKI